MFSSFKNLQKAIAENLSHRKGAVVRYSPLFHGFTIYFQESIIRFEYDLYTNAKNPTIYYMKSEIQYPRNTAILIARIYNFISFNYKKRTDLTTINIQLKLKLGQNGRVDNFLSLFQDFSMFDYFQESLGEILN